MPDFDASDDAIAAARAWLDELELVELWRDLDPHGYETARDRWLGEMADEAALKRAQARTDEDLRV